MAGFQVAGLASDFDWKTFVDQIINVERAPINRLTAEQAKNTQKSSRLAGLGTKLTALQDASSALSSAGLFNSRTAKSSTTSSTWVSSASSGAATGSYQIAVSQLATSARREGAADVGRRLSETSDVSGLTLANLPLSGAVTAGTFTVNGAQVTVALTDSLQDVFDAISTATSGAVTASYDETTDRVTLSGSGEVVFGAANDSSNFLRALKLSNNGTAAVTSSSNLGAVKTTAALASGNLSTAITAVDGSGNGTFSINGVSIAYNVNDDSLSEIITRINDSSAGVTATYDTANDRMVLTNGSTGDIGMSLNESAGGLLGALGLTTGGTLVRGNNAEFTVNGGGTLVSMSNTLDSTAHGITGLSVKVDSESTQTIAVAADTTPMKGKIDAFIAAFNDVQTYLEDASRITSANGKVTAGILADNREVQSWGTQLRSRAFAEVAGATGTIKRLEHLGIDFNSDTGKLEIKNASKLDAALVDKGNEVEAFFNTATTGFAAKLEDYVTHIVDINGDQQANFAKANTGIDEQIATIERRLEQQRAVLESAFIAMEQAQSQIKNQQAAIDNAFFKQST